MANAGYPVVNRGASILPYLTWGTQNPTIDGAPGEPGMLYLQIASYDNLVATVGIYQKINTAGNDTNWQKIGPGAAGGVTNIGGIDSQPKSANGAVIVGTNLYFQTADATNPGLLSIIAQQIAGEKTFLEAIVGQEIATPANPAAGFLKLYFKVDGNLYQLDSAGVETKITNQSIIASQVAYTPTTPANWPVVPVNVQDGLDTLASIVNLLNPINIYVDDAAGSDLTGTGSLLRPYKTLEAALANYTAAAVGNYLINLAPGNYGLAPIAIPVLLNKTLGIKGEYAGNTNINVDITYTSLGLSDENFYMSNLSVGPQMVFDLTLGTVANITLVDGGYHVKRVDTLAPGPQVIRIFNSFCDGFDISGSCLMTGCQFVGGGTNIVQPAGFLLMTGCLFASMAAQIDGVILLAATLAQGTVLTGAGTVNSDSSSFSNLTVTGPAKNYTDNAQTIAFAPAIPANWPVVPTTVKEALDSLATGNSVPLAQVKFVSSAGNDATGSGSIESPFLTITAALNSILDNTDVKKYTIIVAPGVYSEPTIAIKPNVDIVGFSSQAEACETVGISSLLVLDPSWTTDSTGSSRVNISGIKFSSTSTIDNTTILGTGAIKFQQCTFDLVSNFVDPAAQMAVLFDRTTFSGGANFTGFIQVNGRMNLQGPSSYTSAGNGGNPTFVIENGIVIGGQLVVTCSATDTLLFALRNTQTLSLIGGSLSLINLGAGFNFLYTVDSLPDAASFTNSGATLVPVSYAEGLGYVPATPANWSTPPTEVKGALDQLSSRQTLVVERVITAPEAAAKQIVLVDAPFNVNAVSVAFGGIEQTDSVDFLVTGSIIDWTGLGMDTIGVALGDILVITYEKG